jgi:GTP-binding protein
VKILRAEFVTSAVSAKGFPRERLPELAMVGRSNVGKSSVINALVGRTLARTSAEPGKTRLANVYRVSPGSTPAFHLIDLPGYGYARAARPDGGPQRSAKVRRDETSSAFAAMTSAYFGRVSGQGDAASPFVTAMLLVDSRHPGLPADCDAWKWLGSLGVPRLVVATKIDKLTRAERLRHMAELTRIFEGPVTAVSAANGEGLEALWTQIARLLRQPPPIPAPPPTQSR